ncbi:MAG: beta-lactamase class [Mycobacterium sp.]|nr:beta-lactamase class [Mycobacterium sp.]
MCSTFKGYAVARVLQMSERGELRLDDAIRIDRAVIVSNSPVTEPAIGGPPAITAFAGLRPGWTTADKTGSGDYGSTNDVGIAYGPDGRRVLLSIMTRSRTDDPKAENLRPLIGQLTNLALWPDRSGPWVASEGAASSTNSTILRWSPLPPPQWCGQALGSDRPASCAWSRSLRSPRATPWR